MQELIHNRRFLLFLFLAALLVRFCFVPNPGFEADISFWKSWGLAPFDHGLVEGLTLTNNNYPTPFGYLLWTITAVYSIFANPHLFTQFWANTNLLFLTLIKTPAILSDLGIAGMIIYIGKNAKKLGFPALPALLYLILAVLYLFNPVAILDSAVWGQVDALGVFLFLGSVVLLLSKKPFFAGLLYMVALMTKLQNMIYGPLFFLFAWQYVGREGLVKAIIGGTVGFFGLNSEFLLAKNMDRVITSLTANYDYFPYLSLNAYNLWWIVAKGFGMQVSDKMLAVGIVNAKTVGLVLFSGSYLLAVLTMLRKKNTTIVYTFFLGLIIAAGGFFLFQTQSHDRYAFPLIMFLLLWLPHAVAGRTTIKERESFWKTRIFQYSIIGYILFTLLYFINMHTALIINYPKNGLTVLSFLQTPFYTITISYLLLFGYGYFLLANKKDITKMLFIISCCFCISALLLLNLPLMQNRTVSLTKLTPFLHQQQYGMLVANMPVNAQKTNSKTWDRLSVQYMFYEQGLGTHANSTIVYDIGRRFRTFETDMGIDTEAGPNASVVFAIYGDNTLLFMSPVIKRYENPIHATVTVRGVSQLKLVVTDADDGNTDDHADWLHPQLVP